MPPQRSHTSHLQVLPCSEIMLKLENEGEVNLAVAEHKTAKDQQGNVSFQSLQKVAFVLDPIKTESEKKNKKAGHM